MGIRFDGVVVVLVVLGLGGKVKPTNFRFL